MNYDVVIGLEIHIQLKTAQKAFCSCSSNFNEKPNTQVCVVCGGFPGGLPVLNPEVVEAGIKIALGLQSKIRETSVFARKNYFYPDLTKGYQISQHDKPISEGGEVVVYVQDKESKKKVPKKIRIHRAHLEEDTGRSIHLGDHSLIDFNRSGLPLMEVVSEPDISTPREAMEYARTVRRLVRYLDVCSGNLEEGAMRCDCNISLKPKGQIELGSKVEIKNINSFKFIEKSLAYEILRQQEVLDKGEVIRQQTRGFNGETGETFLMREKENAADYRYFPEPDMPYLVVSQEKVQRIKKSLPELPLEKLEKFQKNYSFSFEEAYFLSGEKEISSFFEQVEKKIKNPKTCVSFMMGDVQSYLKKEKKGFASLPFSIDYFCELLNLIDGGTISQSAGKVVLQKMLESNNSPTQIVEEENLGQVSDPKIILQWVQESLLENPKQLEQYHAGKDKLFGFFVGQVMKKSQGKANPSLINDLIKDALKKEN